MLKSRTVVARAMRAVLSAARPSAAFAVTPSLVRNMASGVESGEETEEIEYGDDDVDISSMSAEELIAFVEANEEGREAPLPIMLDEAVAKHFRPFWAAIEAAGAAPEEVQAELAGLLEVIDVQPEFISRYFDGPTPRAEESALVMSTLFEGKVTKLSDVKDEDLRNDVFDSQLVLDEFLDASKDLRDALKHSALVADYVAALVSANQVHLLRPTYDAIARIADASTTMADVTVQSAVALTAAQQDKIRAGVAQYLPAGKDDSDIEFSVDASIAGGIVVTVDNSVVDLSAATFLANASAAVDVTEEARA